MTNKFINLTPHTITIIGKVGNIVVPPSGVIARCKVTEETVAEIDCIEVVKTTYGEVEGLPEKEDNTVCLVSGFVMNALKGSGRYDVMKPYDFVRDEAGNIIGCRKLATIED